MSIDKSTIPDMTVITLLNKFVTGDILLNKDGEVLESWTLVDKMAELVKSLFGYGTEPLEGVEFTVYATEDIYHPDGVTGLLFHAGDVVATGVRTVTEDAVEVTDEYGMVEFNQMYLGQYEVVETETADGYVILRSPSGNAGLCGCLYRSRAGCRGNALIDQHSAEGGCGTAEAGEGYGQETGRRGIRLVRRRGYPERSRRRDCRKGYASGDFQV